MSSIAKPQDLPPQGGFGKIIYDKVPHKTFFNGKRIALAVCIGYSLGIWGFCDAMKKERLARLERMSSRNAIQPFLTAERDRQLLKQMKKNRDDEAKLMKDVEGWEVGTLFGTPVYNTVGGNEWIGYSPMAYYAHTNPDDHEAFEGYTFFV